MAKERLFMDLLDIDETITATFALNKIRGCLVEKSKSC